MGNSKKEIGKRKKVKNNNNKKNKQKINMNINKEMLKNVVIIVEVIVIIILLVIIVKEPKGKVLKSSIDENLLKEELRNEILYGKEENVKYTAVGEKENISENMKKAKDIVGYEKVTIENLEIKTTGSVTKLIAKVKNNGKTDSISGYVKIQILDEDKKEIAQAVIYVPNLKVGEDISVESTLTLDIANAYDYIATK